MEGKSQCLHSGRDRQNF